MRFKVSFTIPASLLSTVVSVLTPEVRDLEIQQAGAGASEHKFRRRTKRETPALDVTMSVFADGAKHSSMEVAAALNDAGMNANSASPSLSRLCNTGLLKRIAHGWYQKV